MAEERASWITPAIFNDQPLEPDRASSYFQFDNYARTFARIIASTGTRTPLTIGISGEWGSGKTTLMQAIQAYLDGTTGKERPGFVGADDKWPDKENFRPVRTVWFNAWKYSREEALFAALVEEVMRQMRRDGAISRLYANLSDPKSPQILVPEAVLSLISQVFSIGQVDLDLTRFESESRFKANLAFLDEFMEVFDQLVRWWVYRDWRGKDAEHREIDDRRGVLTIFIDDLDRCLPEKTVQVLESIKLMMDRPGTIFVIGASRGVVEKAVAAHYRKGGFGDLSGESGRYLDKIIQIRFDLPPLQPEGPQSLGDFLDGLQAGERRLAETNPTLVKSLKLLTRGGETNPRRIKTFVNYAELQWALLVNSEQAEGANQEHFNLWLVLTEAGGEPFRAWLEQLPGPERPRRIQEGIGYAQKSRGGEPGKEDVLVDPNLGALIDGNRRLRGVLEQLEEFDVSPKELHLYIHLCAPPVEEVELAPPTAAQVAPRSFEKRRAGVVPGEFVMDQFVRVPKGSFLMGSADDDSDAYDDEKPQHEYDIPYGYDIARYPVTNAEFARFVEDGGYTNSEYWTRAGWKWREENDRAQPEGWEGALENRSGHPVVGASWYEAVAYCRWLTAHLQERGEISEDWEARLPSEAEWEKAARGEFGRRWPWGDEQPTVELCNFDNNIGGTTLAGQYSPQGDSPYGCTDMAGNVWEWTRSLWGEDLGKADFGYPYDPGDGRENLEAGRKVRRVLRGGAFNNEAWYVRCACRSRGNPNSRFRHSGFRVVASPVTSEL